METKSFESSRSTLIGHRLGLVSIVGLWGFYFVIITMRAGISGYPHQMEMMLYRIAVTSLAIGLTFLLYLFLERFADRPLRWRIAIAFAAAVPVAGGIAAFNLYLFEFADPLALFKGEEWEAERELIEEFKALNPWAMWQGYAEAVMSRYFVVIAWALLYMALGYAQIVRQAERRAAIFAQEAQTAQLRALRYQVNPHFLFNTLNAISTLILEQQTELANRMVTRLSSFLRYSLDNDPMQKITLDQELAALKLYLDIEKVRFEERLSLELDIGDEASKALIPSLLLQPLVENAIKYGIARSVDGGHLRIAAKVFAGDLLLELSDDGPGVELVDGLIPNANGVGLRNTQERLVELYGNQHSFRLSETSPHGLTVNIRITLETALK